ELAISMVKAGQEGGFLEDVLKRIADFTEHQEDLKAKVVGALAYPVILAVLGTLILFALIIFIVPRFEPIFKKLDEQGELPTLTVLIMAVSHSLLSIRSVAIGGGVLIAIVAFVRWKNSPSGRLRMDGWRLRIPGAGRIYLNYALSRFTRILGTLLH